MKQKKYKVSEIINYAVIMEMTVGQWITRADCAVRASTSIGNSTITKTLNELVERGYLHAVSLSQFHPHCRQIVYVRTQKGFSIETDVKQMALNLVYGD